MSSVSKPRGGKTKAQHTATSDRHSVVFFGYELPGNITKDDILLLLNKYKQTIIDIEVVHKKKGNYAKITFITHAAAQAVIKRYSGQYWYEFGVRVVLKPWEETRESQEYENEKLFTHGNRWTVHSYEEAELYSQSSDEMHGQSAGSFLSPYPKLSNATQTESLDLLTDSHTNNYESLTCDSKEYTIKVYGLNFDVRKQEMNTLVMPFGDLTSPVKINCYPKNNVCYAYVNYCDRRSAIAAVSKLDGSEFNGTKIHVCHKGQLEVEHNCRSEHRTLNDGQRLVYDSITISSSKRDSEKLQKSHASTQ